jgi:hypothetical protein
MDIFTLQRRLAAVGCYGGTIDGIYGPMTRRGVFKVMSDGPDLRLSEDDALEAADRLQVNPAKVWAVYEVESSGSPFIDGRPTILFEPHRFSRATRHRFDGSHPTVSYPSWTPKKYPRHQLGRYEQLLTAVGLNVDAGFASASYGGFQILGENYAVCDAPSPYAFAWRQAQSEGDQLAAFVSFVEGRGLAPALRRGDWAAFAKGYNGTAYRVNRYDERLAAAYARRLGK